METVFKMIILVNLNLSWVKVVVKVIKVVEVGLHCHNQDKAGTYLCFCHDQTHGNCQSLDQFDR